MLLVGELINTSRRSIALAVEARDKECISTLARAQVEAGADCLDINCGSLLARETEAMEWLVATVVQAVPVPLCIDSPRPEALAVGLELAQAAGRPLVNSITAEDERFRAVLPLVLRYRARVVGLCLDRDGLPRTAPDKLRVGMSLLDRLRAEGVDRADVFLDPLVEPLSTQDRGAAEVAEALRLVKAQAPEAGTVVGLSNVSFGLPARRLLNRAFLTSLVQCGLDAAIADPTDRELMAGLYAALAVAGRDRGMRDYLRAYRGGLLG